MVKIEELPVEPEGIRLRPATAAGEGKPKQKPLIDISEEDQQRIINESGVLNKIPRPSEEGDDDDMPIYVQSLLLVIPLTLMHALLTYVIHMQYGFTDEYTLMSFLETSGLFFVAFYALVHITSIFKNHILTQLLFAGLSVFCGVTLIKLTEGHETFGKMLRTPGLAVVWIYTVIQMKLGIAAGSLFVPAFYYYSINYLSGKNKSSMLKGL